MILHYKRKAARGMKSPEPPPDLLYLLNDNRSNLTRKVSTDTYFLMYLINCDLTCSSGIWCVYHASRVEAEFCHSPIYVAIEFL
ncbi:MULTISPECIES: hypothetical protein [unclassified Bradyrhizobium]|uniref:hypothetical protein n=1 Tax=unclassified Bradyrhizobium TaxID=2631580 RepID=UPI0028ECB71A|nr:MULTISPECIES: hypothetical protein [unclassified Bradyrhizobium]